LSCGSAGVLEYEELDFLPESLEAGDAMREHLEFEYSGGGERVNCTRTRGGGKFPSTEVVEFLKT
jgi:hypothetical protein